MKRLFAQIIVGNDDVTRGVQFQEQLKYFDTQSSTVEPIDMERFHLRGRGRLAGGQFRTKFRRSFAR